MLTSNKHMEELPGESLDSFQTFDGTICEFLLLQRRDLIPEIKFV